MQVFLPSDNFVETARVLDKSRLGNQCYRECLTLYRGNWPNHPASKMWGAYKHYLCVYAALLAVEGEHRGYAWGNKWRNFWFSEAEKHTPVQPHFLGAAHFHASHRSNLLRKGVEDATFLLFKNDPRFPSRKSEWTANVYEYAWGVNGGKPKNHWYAQFGWPEPDNLPYVWPV